MNNTDITISRITGYTELVLPNPFEDIMIAPNEWATYDIFNHSIDLLIENYDYLERMSKIYDIPPNSEVTSWLGSSTLSGEKWHISDDISTNVSGLFVDVNDVTFLSASDWMVVANESTVHLISSDDTDIIEIDSIDETGVDQKFGVIKSIGVDSKDRIIVMDSSNLRLVTLSYDIDYASQGKCSPWETLKVWGSFGAKESKYGFASLADMVVENDYVYALDSRNGIIKKYNTEGFHKLNIANNIIKEAKSIAVTDKEDIFILVNNTVIQLDIKGEITNSFSIETLNDTPQRIRLSYDYNFIYISLSQHISKVTVDGRFAGIFSGVGDKNYLGLYSASDGSLYVTNKISILKFNDELYFFSYKPNMTQYLWSQDDLHIKKDEFIDAWVYNRSFHRFFDNIEIYRRSLYGKPLIKEREVNQSDGSILSILKYISIRPFTIDELQNFMYQKNDIYIGINELVAPNVVNRCLYQLYINQTKLLDLLIEEHE